jgi:hypothetical protein
MSKKLRFKTKRPPPLQKTRNFNGFFLVSLPVDLSMMMGDVETDDVRTLLAAR